MAAYTRIFRLFKDEKIVSSHLKATVHLSSLNLSYLNAVVLTPGIFCLDEFKIFGG